MTDRTPSAAPPGAVAATPEAGPPAPPAWRDHFNDPILQPGQRHAPRQDPAAPVAATPEAGPVRADGQPAAPLASPTPPLARSEEPVLEPGQVTPEAIVRSVKGFVEASPEERNRMAREAGRLLGPVAAGAETLLARGLNLGARGLNGLAERIERRRREREDAGRG